MYQVTSWSWFLLLPTRDGAPTEVGRHHTSDGSLAFIAPHCRLRIPVPLMLELPLPPPGPGPLVLPEALGGAPGVGAGARTTCPTRDAPAPAPGPGPPALTLPSATAMLRTTASNTCAHIIRGCLAPVMMCRGSGVTIVRRSVARVQGQAPRPGRRRRELPGRRPPPARGTPSTAAAPPRATRADRST